LSEGVRAPGEPQGKTAREDLQGYRAGKRAFTMNPNELLRIVDSLHREKNIDPEIVFQAIEAALATAAKRQYGEDSEITVSIDRPTGATTAYCNGELLDPEEMIGRIGAQTAKQVIIQKIREAERDSLIEEFQAQLGQLVNGVVQRYEHNATTVSLGNIEAICREASRSRVSRIIPTSGCGRSFAT
jgi:transcription termination/antitermination protein NusA